MLRSFAKVVEGFCSEVAWKKQEKATGQVWHRIGTDGRVTNICYQVGALK